MEFIFCTQQRGLGARAFLIKGYSLHSELSIAGDSFLLFNSAAANDCRLYAPGLRAPSLTAAVLIVDDQ